MARSALRLLDVLSAVQHQQPSDALHTHAAGTPHALAAAGALRQANPPPHARPPRTSSSTFSTFSSVSSSKSVAADAAWAPASGGAQAGGVTHRQQRTSCPCATTEQGSGSGNSRRRTTRWLGHCCCSCQVRGAGAAHTLLEGAACTQHSLAGCCPAGLTILLPALTPWACALDPSAAAMVLLGL
jgi:hypothetical protein